MKVLTVPLCAVLASLFFLGCSGPAARKVEPAKRSVRSTASEPPSAQPTAKEVEPAKTKLVENPEVTLGTGAKLAGLIRGEVLWNGPVPLVPTSEDQVVPVRGKMLPVTPSPRVLVGPKGGLANALVYLKKAPPQAEPFNPEVVSVVQSKGCYDPAVQVAARGSRLKLRTTDDRADFHLSGEASASRALERGKVAFVSLQHTGLVIVTSEDRPWMTPAHVHVLDHTYFAITSEDGRFELPKLPPGEYQVVLWHEGWAPPEALVPPAAERTVTVKLGPDQGAAIRWVLPAP